ncbi:hypothetical protein CF336_g6914 [Tilletia laevis]|nr:hypothetical protein CF336_g6914 [Tilletia laevis]
MGPLKAPSSSHSWPNQYPPEHQSIIDEWIEDARRSTFIAGPFDPEQVKAVIGHVRASPVLLVQKLDEHGVVVKNRVVYNASRPRTSKLEPPPPIPSINSQINKADYPCLWMTAVETKHMHIPTNARAEVKDWLIFFNQWLIFFNRGPISCRLDLPTSLFPLQLYTDASDFGVGIVLGSLSASFPLPNDYTDRLGINIGVGEAWIFELGVYAAIEHGAHDCLLTVYVDNQGIVFAARRGRSRNDLANDAIDRAADAALAANVELSSIYVASADNVADAPSRSLSSPSTSPLLISHSLPWAPILYYK